MKMIKRNEFAIVTDQSVIIGTAGFYLD